MSLWNRLLAAFRKGDGAPSTAPAAHNPAQSPSPTPRADGSKASDRSARPRAPAAPTLAEMRERLRAGMSRDEFYTTLDEIVVTRGLRMSLPSNDERVIALPVAEGGELLCFLPAGVLTYVEYKGGVFLEL